jgi:hypothetical protein
MSRKPVAATLVVVTLTMIVAAGAAIAPAGTASNGQSVGTATPVMTGLDNPRGLAFGRNGALYVVEAGRGGTGPCVLLRPGVTACYGATGRISRLWHGEQSEVVTGLPSAVMTTGADVGATIGAHDLALQGVHGAISIGLGGDPAVRNTSPSPVWQLFDHLATVDLKRDRWKLGVDIGAYETAANPGGGPIDSNPYGILRRHGRLLLTDAGGNTLLQVRADESDDTAVATAAVFPSRTSTPPHPSCAFPGFPPLTDSVPTQITVGPDGAYYVGELSGAPFCTGNANVYRIVPGQEPTVYCGGFTTIIDLAWGPDGQLYVAQHSNGPAFFATQGDVVRVGPGCSKTPVTPPLNRPGAIAFGREGELYVSVNSNQIGTGQVVRID